MIACVQSGHSGAYRCLATVGWWFRMAVAQHVGSPGTGGGGGAEGSADPSRHRPQAHTTTFAASVRRATLSRPRFAAGRRRCRPRPAAPNGAALPEGRQIGGVRVGLPEDVRRRRGALTRRHRPPDVQPPALPRTPLPVCARRLMANGRRSADDRRHLLAGWRSREPQWTR